MVGSELNPTQGKRGGKPGDIGASSSPSSSHPQPAQQALPGVFSHGFSLSFLFLCSETARKHLLRRLSHPTFFPRQLFARVLQSESLEQQATPEPSSLGSQLCTILPLPGAWAPASACFFVCYYWFLSHYTFRVFFVVSSSLIPIRLECKQIVLFSSRQSPLLYVRSWSALLPLQLQQYFT